jgi:hypothetical protein
MLAPRGAGHPDRRGPAVSAKAEAQDEKVDRPAQNGVFLEGLGPGILYSVNYDAW